jgi:hypothetical protein
VNSGGEVNLVIGKPPNIRIVSGDKNLFATLTYGQN